MDRRKLPWVVLGVAAVMVAVAVPSALALRASPVRGGDYEYMKIAPKSPDWHSTSPNILDTVGVEVSADGKYVRAGWSVNTKSGCVSSGYGGHVIPTANGIIIEKIPLKPNGSFHGVDRRKIGGKYARSHVSEIVGQFTADGSYVQVRLRQKLYVYKAKDMWARCDGRWLRFRPCYTQGHNLPPRCAKPPEAATEP